MVKTSNRCYRYLHEVCFHAFNDHLSKSHELKGFWSIKTWSAAQDFYFQTFPRMVHRRDYSEGETFQKALRFRYICCTSPLMLMCDRTPLPLFLSPYWVQSQISMNRWHFSRELKGGIFEVHRAMAIQLGYKLDTQHINIRETTCSGKGTHAFLGLTFTFTYIRNLPKLKNCSQGSVAQIILV